MRATELLLFQFAAAVPEFYCVLHQNELKIAATA